jgi:hypothetical protein
LLARALAPLRIRRRLSSRRVEELMLLQGVSGCMVRRRSPKSGPLTRCGICQRPCRPLAIALPEQERWPTGNKVAYGLAVPCCHAVTPARFFGLAIPLAVPTSVPCPSLWNYRPRSRTASSRTCAPFTPSRMRSSKTRLAARQLHALRRHYSASCGCLM